MSMEALAVKQASSDLSPLERAFKLTYECGVEAPTLASTRHNDLDIRVASLFLKRTLNDLRCTWVLLAMGYTSQSAAVAASLWENALAVACIAGHPDRAQKAAKAKGGDLPWPPMQLAKTCAADQTGDRGSEYELRWREHYGPYKWLCKIKHPTLKSVLHDAFSAQKDAETYVVMAVPDLRPENRGVKLGVATIALNRALSCVSEYLDALRGSATGDTRYGGWYARWKEAAAITVDTLENGDRPVITIDEDSPILREYQRLANAAHPAPTGGQAGQGRLRTAANPRHPPGAGGTP